MTSPGGVREAIHRTLEADPIVGVIRTDSQEEAQRQARDLIAGGIALIEVTFSVPETESVLRELLSQRPQLGPPWIGAGTVTSAARATSAIEAGAEFIVSPNTNSKVAQVASAADRFLVLGALTPTEIVRATELGADLVKVYPLPPVGGALYLATVRQPLSDIPMLAAGGFPVEEIPSYRQAGAIAFGMGAPLLTSGPGSKEENAAQALAIARGERS